MRWTYRPATPRSRSSHASSVCRSSRTSPAHSKKSAGCSPQEERSSPRSGGLHEFQSSVVDATNSLFPDDPPSFLQSVVHSYPDPLRISADLKAGGLEPVSIQEVTLEGRTPSASEIVRGYGLGTPLTAELQARGDLNPVLDAITAELERRFGAGPIVGRMTALVIEARSPRSSP